MTDTPEAASSATKPCECIHEMDQALKKEGYNAAIVCTLMSAPPRAVIETYKPKSGRNAGKKPPVVIASYCPFCGLKYPEPKSSRKGAL
jgi:hypothetical protein